MAKLHIIIGNIGIIEKKDEGSRSKHFFTFKSEMFFVRSIRFH